MHEPIPSLIRTSSRLVAFWSSGTPLSLSGFLSVLYLPRLPTDWLLNCCWPSPTLILCSESHRTHDRILLSDCNGSLFPKKILNAKCYCWLPNEARRTQSCYTKRKYLNLRTTWQFEVVVCCVSLLSKEWKCIILTECRSKDNFLRALQVRDATWMLSDTASFFSVLLHTFHLFSVRFCDWWQGGFGL
jgi:hypothetical protein